MENTKPCQKTVYNEKTKRVVTVIPINCDLTGCDKCGFNPVVKKLRLDKWRAEQAAKRRHRKK